MKKNRSSNAQAMVEFALLASMVVVSMIIILGTVGGAVGSVWQAIVDNFETNPMFSVPTSSYVSTLASTSETPTLEPTATLTPGGPSITPTETLLNTLTPSATFTDVPTSIPTATSTTYVATAIPTNTPVMLAVVDANVERLKNLIKVAITVNRTVDLSVKDTFTNAEQFVTCSGICNLKFDPLPSGGYIEIRSAFGDNINLQYPPAN